MCDGGLVAFLGESGRRESVLWYLIEVADVAAGQATETSGRSS